MKGNLKYIIIAAVIAIIASLIVQYIRFKNCEEKVWAALEDPSLQTEYKYCTVNGFEKIDYDTHSVGNASVSRFPFQADLLHKYSV